jgi:hypothetical protein
MLFLIKIIINEEVHSKRWADMSFRGTSIYFRSFRKDSPTVSVEFYGHGGNARKGKILQPPK